MARQDFTTKAAAILETELTAAGVPHDLKVYPGTKHAFFNDTLRTYHAAAAADSWQRVLAFFAEHVGHAPALEVPELDWLWRVGQLEQICVPERLRLHVSC